MVFDAALGSFWLETSPGGAAQESPGRKPWDWTLAISLGFELR